MHANLGSLTLLTSVVFAALPSLAKFQPREILGRDGMPLPKRQAQYACEAPTADVSEEYIIEDACQANPQNDFQTCYNNLVAYIQSSAGPTCVRYYTQYNDCLVLNNYNETSCSDSRTGYVNCANYTLQAYAYCGCYYALPDQLYSCANVQLQIRPNKPAATTSLATDTADYVGSGFLTGPISPASTSGQSLLTFFNPSPTPTTVGIVTSTTNSQGSVVATTTYPSITHTFTPMPVVDSGVPPSSSSSSVSANTPVLVANTDTGGVSSTTSTPSTPVAYGGGAPSYGSGSASSDSNTATTTSSSSPRTMSTLPTTTMYANHPSSSGSSSSTTNHQTTATYTSVGTSTGVSTITSCPAARLYPCPSLGYTSLETYTTTYTSTYYSCDGGCDGVEGNPTGYFATATTTATNGSGTEAKEICVRRLRKRVFVGGREL